MLVFGNNPDILLPKNDKHTPFVTSSRTIYFTHIRLFCHLNDLLNHLFFKTTFFHIANCAVHIFALTLFSRVLLCCINLVSSDNGLTTYALPIFPELFSGITCFIEETSEVADRTCS